MATTAEPNESKDSIVVDLSQAGGDTDMAGIGDIRFSLRDGQLRIRKDLFSTTPLYFQGSDRRLMASRNFSDVLTDYRDRGSEATLDRGYLKSYLEFQTPCTSRTFVNDIHFLRAGTEVIFGRSGEIREVLALPDPKAPVPTETEAIQGLEAELGMLDYASTYFHISSGLDSSLLVLLAAQRKQRPLQLVSCTTQGQGAGDELPIVEKIAAKVGGELSVFDFRAVDLLACAQSMADVLPFPLGYPSQIVEYLIDSQALKSSGKDKVTIVTGKGPDEVLGGYAWHAEEFHNPEKFRARKTVTGMAQLERLMDFPVHPGAIDIPGSDFGLGSRLVFDIRSLAESWNVLHAGIQAQFPIRFSNPLLAPGLRRFFFSLDDHARIRNGEGKVFLRDRFRSLYPDYVLSAPKKGLRLDLAPYWRDVGAERLFRTFRQDFGLPDGCILDGPLQEMIEETLSGTKNWGWQLWNLLLASIFVTRLELHKAK